MSSAKYAKNQKLYLITGYLFGLNRIYLFQFNKVVTLLSYLYTLILLSYSSYFAYSSNHGGAAVTVLKYVFVLHFAVLVIDSSFRVKKPSMKFYTLLNRFDNILKIKDGHISSFGNCWLWISFISECFDSWYLTYFMFHENNIFIIIAILVWFMNRDSEILFHIGNLRHISLRVSLLKLHVKKVFGAKETWCQSKDKKLSTVEYLCHREELDISVLHHAYETLHKCSTQMNSLTNISMFMILTTTVVTVIFSWKGIIKILVSSALTMKLSEKFTVLFLLMRCVKYLSIVVVPCHQSGVVDVEVYAMRSLLYDAIRTQRLDTINHNKAKAFLALIKDSQFSYTLITILKLDMTLPWKFLNFCLTYFIIVIQFSKFID